MTRLELADMLDRFVGDAPGCGEWEWDDFTSVRAEPELESFRQRLLQMDDGKFDVQAIRRMSAELRTAPGGFAI